MGKALFAESLQEELRFKEAVAQEEEVLSLDPHFPCAHARARVLVCRATTNFCRCPQSLPPNHKAAPLTALGRAKLERRRGR